MPTLWIIIGIYVAGVVVFAFLLGMCKPADDKDSIELAAVIWPLVVVLWGFVYLPSVLGESVRRRREAMSRATAPKAVKLDIRVTPEWASRRADLEPESGIVSAGRRDRSR